MLKLFERFINPFPPEHPQQPPAGIYAFCRHYTRGLEVPLVFMSVLTALLAILEVMMFGFMGNLVDWLSQKAPETLLAEEGGRLLLMSLMVLLVMPLVLYFLFPPEIKNTPNAKELAPSELSKLGPVKTSEKITLSVLGLMLLMWASVPALLFGPAYEINATTTAFVGLSLLLLTGVLGWEDILKAKSAWDTLIWFAALVMMATFLGRLGLIAWFSLSIQTGISYLGLGWMAGAAILVAIYFYAHYFFASTTAHITAMFAAFFTAGVALGAPPMLLALVLAFSSSLMMSLTHYGTGTAPIIFGSGYTTLNEWWGAGLAMSVANLLILIVVGGLWWSVLGYI